MDVAQFLRTVVTSPEGGWFCLGYAKILDGNKKIDWNEEFYSWPDEISTVVSRIHTLAENYDVYYSPYLFTEQSSKKEHAIVGRTIVADLDEANILTIPLEPTVLVESSPGRHQGYWILKDQLDREEHEQLSKRITYAIPRCDRTGWFLGKKVRPPETYNNKYTVGPQYVRVVRNNGRVYNNQEIENLTTVKELFGTTDISKLVDEENLDWADKALEQPIGPQEMLSKVRSSIPTIVTRYNIIQKDRSAALWSLYLSLFRAGLTKEQVFFIAYHSPNNKFKELRYGGIKELAKDVLRALAATKVQLPDVKTKIREARRLGDNEFERNEYIARCVREHLDRVGNFVHASDDSMWFVREDIGRPIAIGRTSEHFFNLLDNIFGINASEKLCSYIGHNLSAMVSELPITGRVSTLSYYDHDTRTFTLHTGRKDMLIVTAENIARVTNGSNGIIFPWTLGNNAISPRYATLEDSWDHILFDDCLNNVLNIKKSHAKAILKVWLLSVLLRDGLTSRPILALFGMPGSGKSTLFRRIYALLYGKERGLNTVTREDDFDHAMSVDPLVVLDNVDTAERWLPDRLAATVAPTEITKRKLFTDSDTVTLRRQAMLGITAHNPKFSREDVTDRLLLLTFERLEHFKPDNVILDKIVKNRNALWGAILEDIQLVLRQDFPKEGFPQFRIEDFAQFGYWIANAVGVATEFKDGIESIKNEQRSLNLEEDMLLLDAIDRLLSTGAKIYEAPAGQLWIQLRRYSKDERSFDKRYMNAVALGRKFWTLLPSMREMYDIDWKLKRGVRVWTIEKLPDEVEVEVGTNAKATQNR